MSCYIGVCEILIKKMIKEITLTKKGNAYEIRKPS
jgi:hypothetical protein